MRASRQPVRAVVALSAVVAVAAVGLLLLDVPQAGGPLIRTSPLATVALLAAAFLAAERLVFHVEFRREAISFSPSEVPLAYGLVFLAPWQLVVARLVGAGVAAFVETRRPPPYKIGFNLSVFALEAALASAILRRYARPGSPFDDESWIALFAAIAVPMAVGGVLVSVAVSLFDGGWRRHLALEARFGHALYGIGAATGVLAVAPAVLDPKLAVLCLVPMGSLWAVIRAHGALGQRYRDLEELHAFTSVVGGSLELEHIARAAVEKARALLRTERALLIVLRVEATPLVVAAGAPLALDDLPTTVEAWFGALDPRTAGAAIVHPRTAVLPGPSALAVRGAREAIVAPVSDEVGTLGVLVVVNRVGAHDHFGPDELVRVRPLAQQLAASLRKGLLHGRIEHEARYDRLTGLPNRSQLETRIREALGPDGDRPTAVIAFDLDRLADVNNTFGFPVGDALLRACHERVGDLLGSSASVARLGADEFAVLLPSVELGRAAETADRLGEALRTPFQLGDLRLVVGASVGVAAAPDHGTEALVLLRHAEIAMDAAKRQRSGRELYRPEIDAHRADQLAMLVDLRTAIEQGEIDPWFQPKVDLRTGLVTGAEALVRWTHPERGLVSPDRFIPLAEQSGLIGPLTERVLDRALGAVRRWRALGHKLGVSVNLSPTSFHDERLPEQVAALLARHAVAGEDLTLEITESVVMSEGPRSAGILDRLHRLGCRISVDDFGTGYSSLTTLRRMPVDEIKIDRSFVRDLLIEEHDEVIVRSTIDLGHNLGLRVVAEGVEQQDVLARLGELGCDEVQGYGIARPLALDRFELWLTRSAPSRAAAGTRQPLPERATDRLH